MSKKYFKKAVDRNRIKRALREAYRHVKQPLLNSKQNTVIIFLLYIDKTLPATDLQSLMQKAVVKITATLNEIA